MADIRQQGYFSILTPLTTQMDALASSSASAAGPAQGSDSGDAEVLLDFELKTGGSITPGTNPRIDLYIIRSIDGTDYEDVVTGASESLPPDAFVGSFVPTAGAGTKIMVLRDIACPPGLWKALVLNEGGVALSGTGNVLTARPHSFQTV
jgi:hypothetical protein